VQVDQQPTYTHILKMEEKKRICEKKQGEIGKSVWEREVGERETDKRCVCERERKREREKREREEKQADNEDVMSLGAWCMCLDC